eukprot:scaffold4_cov247-Pinguiococcus_pyrenoidosus.AAC.14
MPSGVGPEVNPGMAMAPNMNPAMMGEGQDPMGAAAAAAAAYINPPGMMVDAGMRPYAPQHARGVHVPVVDPGPPIKVRDVDRGPEGCNLFIFHVPNDLTNIALYRLFQPFGPMLSARIMVDKRTGCSRGFGFVSYENHEAAANAIKCMNGFQLGHKRLKVELKKEKGARGSERSHHHGPHDDHQYMSVGGYMHAGMDGQHPPYAQGADGGAMGHMHPMYQGSRMGHHGQGRVGVQPGMDANMGMGMVDENGYYQQPVDLARKGYPGGPMAAGMMPPKMGYHMEGMAPVGPEGNQSMWPVDSSGNPLGHTMGPGGVPLVMDEQAQGIIPVPMGDPTMMQGAVVDMSHLNHLNQYSMGAMAAANGGIPPHFVNGQMAPHYAGMMSQGRPQAIPGPAVAAEDDKSVPKDAGDASPPAAEERESATQAAAPSASDAQPAAAGSSSAATAAQAHDVSGKKAVPESTSPRESSPKASADAGYPSLSSSSPVPDSSIRQIWNQQVPRRAIGGSAEPAQDDKTTTESAAKGPENRVDLEDPTKDIDKLVENNLHIKDI